MSFARALWTRIELLHAVTYFGPESRAAASALGATGFWMGYFGFRAAPLGRPSAAVVDATFANFSPTFVRRWVPEVWQVIDPTRAIGARADAAAATWRSVGSTDELARRTADDLRSAVDAADELARPLFAANRDLPLPDDPLAALWQRCTTLREHRGDGHLIALASAGVDGLEAHVLLTLERGTDPSSLQLARGWSTDEWADAVERCRARGWVDADGLSEAGRALRSQIEVRTDDLAARAFAHLDDSRRTSLLRALDPPARTLASSGLIPFPNPIGLPPPD